MDTTQENNVMCCNGMLPKNGGCTHAWNFENECVKCNSTTYHCVFCDPKNPIVCTACEDKYILEGKICVEDIGNSS